jgi:meso-butanediol dehydrogenase / (S,S)-butanediol dehydrogenase / diacetyl reductase
MELVIVRPVYILWRRIARGASRRIIRFGKANLISAAGIRGVHNRLPYAASKYRVVGITQTMALELGPLGVRVNAVVRG